MVEFVSVLQQKFPPEAESLRFEAGAELREENLSAETRAEAMKASDPKEMHLMERCIERNNMLSAWKRVKKNGGSPGVDGKSIEETGKDLQTRWPKIRDQLLNGSYLPSPVRRVEIPKPGGGVRQLGIPTVLD